jgi:hypothetical protein
MQSCGTHYAGRALFEDQNSFDDIIGTYLTKGLRLNCLCYEALISPAMMPLLSQVLGRLANC